MTIALLGLSGDPPHLGHLGVAQAVQRLGYPRVWMMVTPQNPDKHLAAAPYWHRRELARLLVQGNHDWLEVSDFEAGVAVHDQELRTYTVLSDLKSKMPEASFTFVMGADAWAHPSKGFHVWKTFEGILDLASVLILPRAPYTAQVKICPAAQHLAARQDEGEGPVAKGCWRLANTPELITTSSTTIRDALQKGESPNLLTPAQNAYIQAHGLYKTSK